VATAAVPGLIVGTAAPASADDSYCRPPDAHERTCIQFRGDKNGFRALAYAVNYYGHVDIWGPGITFEHSATGTDPKIAKNGSGRGWLCAYRWPPPANGRFIDMGIAGGREGFFLQRLRGKGTVWLHGGGDFLDFDLGDGQTLVVDTGCMVMIEPTVKYEVKLQGGIKKSLFGGEGLFLVHMTGPGHVTLQTLPFQRTAERVLEAAHGGGEKGGSGLLGNILGG